MSLNFKDIELDKELTTKDYGTWIGFSFICYTLKHRSGGHDFAQEEIREYFRPWVDLQLAPKVLVKYEPTMNFSCWCAFAVSIYFPKQTYETKT